MSKSTDYAYLSPEFQKAVFENVSRRQQNKKPAGDLEKAQAHLVKTLLGNEVALAKKAFADAVKKMKEEPTPPVLIKTRVELKNSEIANIIQDEYSSMENKEKGSGKNWMKTAFTQLRKKFPKVTEYMQNASNLDFYIVILSMIFYKGVIRYQNEEILEDVYGVTISRMVRQTTDLVPFLCSLFKGTKVVEKVLKRMHPDGFVQGFNIEHVRLHPNKSNPFAYRTTDLLDYRNKALYECLYMFYTGYEQTIRDRFLNPEPLIAEIEATIITCESDKLLPNLRGYECFNLSIRLNVMKIAGAFKANYGKNSKEKAISVITNLQYTCTNVGIEDEEILYIANEISRILLGFWGPNEDKKKDIVLILKEFADSFFIRDFLWITHKDNTPWPEGVKKYEYGKPLKSPVIFNLKLNPNEPFLKCTNVATDNEGMSMVLKTVNAMLCPRQFSISVADMEKICTSFITESLSYQDYLLLDASVVVRVKVTTRI